MAYPTKRINYRTGGYQGMELKFSDISVVNDAFTTTWSTMDDTTTSCLTSITQGVAESDRIGRKYSIRSIHIRCTVHKAALESQAGPIRNIRGRILLVLDTQTNSTQMTATDCMDGGAADDTLSFRNLQNSKRFRVLWDKSWLLRPQNTNEGAVNVFANAFTTTPMMTYNKHFKKPIQVICDATTAVVGAISDNSLHFIGIGQDTTALFNAEVRVRFTG